ncbi:MAG: biotin/lipoyl-containing protein, partial [Acidimicrobiales bacterium]|nr:biotin/lipoyl-containing protein [Acidimicrobiales bacterium]
VMTTRINLPKLGTTMTEATLVEWVKVDGDAVEVNDVLCRIETDKVEDEISSPTSGTLTTVAVEGEVYEVGALLAEIN